MNFLTTADTIATYSDFYDHFTEQWKLHGKEYSQEKDFTKQSVLARRMSLERSIAMALEELTQITTNN